MKCPPVTSKYIMLHNKRELRLQTNFSFPISFEDIIRYFPALSRTHNNRKVLKVKERDEEVRVIERNDYAIMT